MSHAEIQLTLFPSSPELNDMPETIELMRPHKFAHGDTVELPLVSIELVPYENRWMWQSNLNSHNGSSQGAKALPKWNRFAATKGEALLAGVLDVQAFMHRATALEQVRILDWLQDQVSRAAAQALSNRIGSGRIGSAVTVS
uniref:Uncharacterized protein n=1 Tax=Pseudomonas fluorescens (strain SBW25) TaxID=216595 RepID=A0A0G4E5U6_PSEFS|nr:hypothetical protein [Pseudomonas fluorescens]CEK42342.1 hypothetical protein PQBR57_0389 [Pseudomonas fluorescens SBW25]